MYGQVSAAGSSEHSPPHLLLRSLSNLRRACAAVRPRREVAQKAHGHRPRSGSELFASEMLRRRRSDQVSFRIRALGNEGGGEFLGHSGRPEKPAVFTRRRIIARASRARASWPSSWSSSSSIASKEGVISSRSRATSHARSRPRGRGGVAPHVSGCGGEASVVGV